MENKPVTQSISANTFILNTTDTDISDFETLFGPRRDSLYIVIPITIIYVIIFVTGLIGNVSTCIVISRNKSMQTTTNYYLFSLAISDLLLLLCGLPQEMHSIWSRYPYLFGQEFCILRGLFAEASANATVLTITAFTVERYIAICHPFLTHTVSKLSRAVKLILFIWLIAVSFAVPQAIQFDVYPVLKDNPDSKVCLPIHVIMDHAFTVSTVLFFITPMISITVLYAMIGVSLKNSAMIKNTERSRSCGVYSQNSHRVTKMLGKFIRIFIP